MRRYSAPGKLVLCGEYAVLEGRPAIVAAVDRRARVSVEDSEVLRVRGNDHRWLSITDNTLDAPSSALPLLVAVVREARTRGLAVPPGRYSVSTSAFTSRTGKLGLGSSAAAAVALSAALLGEIARRDAGAETVSDARPQPPAWREAVRGLALNAHRAFQGGGSGIDVAASVWGGIARFQEGAAQAAAPIPSALALVVAYTGVPARTQGFIDAWRALEDRRRHIEAIDAATARFCEGCDQDTSETVLVAVRDARRAMAAMGEAAGIDVVTAEHERIADLALAVGGEAKPSGAGGGDIAVCFVPALARHRFERALTAAGFSVVPAGIDDRGAGAD